MIDLEIGVAAARAGAAVVKSNFGIAAQASYKADASPVTHVDRLAEAAILAVLDAKAPDDGFVGEETAAAGAHEGRHWIVDPLDGTVNFMAGIPQVAISVALYDSTEPLAAVVIDAVSGDEFTAVRGGGVQMNGDQVAVSSTTDFDKAVIATGFGYDHREFANEYTFVLNGVLEHVQGIRRFGSAALDLAWVAAGRFDGYFELVIAPWDIAAGLLLVTEAGGTATGWDGTPATPWSGVVVASNGRIHEPLRSIIAERTPDRLR